MRRQFISFFLLSQIASSKDLEPNNVFDDKLSTNNNFRNIFKYKTFNNKEQSLLQSTISFSQLLIKLQQRRIRQSRDFTRKRKTLFETYIITRTSNISMELYVLSTLQQKHNRYSYCDIYQYKKKWKRFGNKIYWQYYFNNRVLVDIISSKDNLENIKILFKFN